jgi:carbon storage regulator
MLILTRKSREAVVVGDASGLEQIIKVTVLEVRASSVKLGFEASGEIPIHRAEVWERIHGEDWTADPEPGPCQPEYELPYFDWALPDIRLIAFHWETTKQTPQVMNAIYGAITHERYDVYDCRPFSAGRGLACL